eukprot:TRINITY_DN5010_c0_g2_i2.p1 TRINITY_DN5010_c0_g2~~TRINITY_DN5010_c0_g2_i2.p1  ORF type:complete len:197 (-),score=43.75 TRINITY_DN5010_c0_g2_i2:60-590(-)
MCIRDRIYTLTAFLRPTLNRRLITPLNALSFYYGAQLGWYFSFYCHYTAWLIPIMVPGILLYLYQYLLPNNDDSLYVIIYCVIIAVWSTTKLEVWKRHQREIAFIWDMEDYQENEQERIQYRGTYAVDEIEEKIVKFDPFTTSKRRIFTDIPLIVIGVGLILALFYTVTTLSLIHI